MTPNIKLNEQVAILSAIDPASIAPGTVLTAWVPMTPFFSLSAIAQLGALGTNATISAQLMQAQDASGTNAKPINGKAIAQINQATTTNSKQFTIECRGEDLDVNNGYGFVALQIVVGVAATFASALLVGANPRSLSSAGLNQASVLQVV